MSLNRKCPKCGSPKVQLSDERSKMGWGCLGVLLFGMWYFFYILAKWAIGLLVFVMWDWYVYLIKAIQSKGHVWQSKKWFSGKKQVYYCHECGYNFRA